MQNHSIDLLDKSDQIEAASDRFGMSRREFLQFCAAMSASLGLPAGAEAAVAQAVAAKERPSVIWLHFQECTGCTESLLRAEHPTIEKLILDVISLDYHETLMAAAGHQAEAIVEEIVEKYKGNYILAVEGNAPLGEDGMYCIIGGKPFVEQLRYAAENCKAIISWGSCASWGCVQAAKPNPTRATPTHKIPDLADKPIMAIRPTLK